MTFQNAFVRPSNEYHRDINILKHYIEDAAFFLHTSTGKPMEQCQQFITESLRPGGRFEFKDPKVNYLWRGENGDRVRGETTLSRYIGDSIKKKELIAPTLTTYTHPDVQESLLTVYVDGNVAKRSKAKKAMFAAKADKNLVQEAVYKIEQTGRKTANNSISGAHVTPSTPLFNKTAHSTLTSTCRSTSGYGNANNEKFLSGNRHYFNHHIVLQNIVSVVNNTDYVKLQAVVDKYNLYLPTAKDVCDAIEYSTHLYWYERHYFQKIVNLVEKLTPIQRAAFLYTGDLYHLKKHNEQMVHTFVKEMASRVTGHHPDPLKAMKQAPEDHANLAHQLCLKEAMGIGKDYSKVKSPADLCTLALTVEHIAATITKYADLIDALWVTWNLPASMAHFPDSIRRSALTSDTDSTIFTVQDWVLWYKNGLSFDDEAMGVAATMIFLASSTITHVLAIMSANFGIVEKRLHQIAMKNEFKFDVFVPTQLGKHYYATISCQEGNVFDEHETEIKGVYLKSSNAPRPIIEGATKMMERIMAETMSDGKINLIKYLKEVADVERSIMESVKKGETTYLRLGSIKDSGSYSGDPESSPYMQHHFWNEVFGPKYGEMPEPPYQTLKVSVDLETPTDFRLWVDSLQDRDMASRLNAWMAKTGRTTMSTFNLPLPALQSRGMPEELVKIIAFRRIVTDIVKIYYLILETLGIFTMEKRVQRLISDFY